MLCCDVITAFIEMFALAGAITQGVPVSVLDDEYTKATFTLGSTIQQYAAIDLYNPERAKVIALTRVTTSHKCSPSDTTTHVDPAEDPSIRAVVDDPFPAAQLISAIKSDGSKWCVLCALVERNMTRHHDPPPNADAVGSRSTREVAVPGSSPPGNFTSSSTPFKATSLPMGELE